MYTSKDRQLSIKKAKDEMASTFADLQLQQRQIIKII